MPHAIYRMIAVSLGLFCIFAAGGCASYSTPGRGADLRALSPEQQVVEADRNIRPALQAKPTANFPAAIATARLQSPTYNPRTVQVVGSGAFCVVITRDVEKDEQFRRLEKMTLVTGLAPVPRILLPQQFRGDEDVRYAAARMRADILILYTFDTSFETRDKAAPLTVISLGLFPTQNIRLVTTASAVLMDPRTGYIYGVAEASERNDSHSSAWTTSRAVDESRLATEAKAFEKLVGEIERTWSGVIRQYAGAYATSPPPKEK